MTDRKSPAPGGAQYPLELPHDPALGRDDFLIAPSNEAAVALIDSWPDWPSPVVLLAGPVGAGKSHLAAIWREQAEGLLISARELAHHDGADLIASGALVIEDADNGQLDQTALFHVLNAARDAHASVLITARSWPEAWPVELPDLASRLRAATPVELGEPDDDLLRRVLFKLMADRQMVVDATVVDYLAVRMERSLEAARRLVSQIDREALATKHRITRPMAARVLQRMLESDTSLVPGAND